MDYIELIFLFHFIGDFVLQTRQMADNKSHSFYWLSIHILVYTIVLALLSWPLFISIQAFTVWILINCFLHLGADFITSKISSFFYLKKNLKWFWITIGFDQLIHIEILYHTFKKLGI